MARIAPMKTSSVLSVPSVVNYLQRPFSRSPVCACAAIVVAIRGTAMDRQPEVDFAVVRASSAAVVTALVLASVVATTSAVSAAGPVDAMRERVLESLRLKPGMVVAEIGVGG